MPVRATDAGVGSAELFIPRGAVAELRARRAAILGILARWSERAGLVFLMLAIGTLLFRPTDLVPSLQGASIYEACMVLCILVSLGRVIPLVRAGALRANAMAAFAGVFVLSVVLSHLARADTWNARIDGLEAVKACILFLLILGLVNTAPKLVAMLLATSASVLAMTALALLNYHGLIHVEALTSVVQASEGEALLRLCGTGIFSDPNDYSLMLVLCMCVCVYVLGWRRLGQRRWLAFLPLAVFGYALILTHSRGGFMSVCAAGATFLVARFGWRNALPLVAAMSVLVLVPVWGRQTEWNVSDPEDTFQARLELWSSSLDEFRGAPLFGIGRGRLAEVIGQVAHNSYLHAFVELGIVGGTVFIGSFFMAVRGLWRVRPVEGTLARLRPCVLAITFAYGAGLLSLSRCYTLPTQMILALACAFLLAASRGGQGWVPRLNAKTVRAVAIAGAVFLAGTYAFVRVMLLRG